MKALVSTAVLVTALATGGIPVVISTVAQTDHAEEGIRVEGKGPAKPADKLADGKPGHGPPAHARSIHHRTTGTPGATGQGERGGAGSGRGPTHGEATRAWATCVSRHAGKDAEGFDPEQACGARPTPPGHQKQKAKSAAPDS